jgi:hypothetical protein
MLILSCLHRPSFVCDRKHEDKYTWNEIIKRDNHDTLLLGPVFFVLLQTKSLQEQNISNINMLGSTTNMYCLSL